MLIKQFNSLYLYFIHVLFVYSILMIVIQLPKSKTPTRIHHVMFSLNISLSC